MLTNLRIRNFKRLEDVEIELGNMVVFIGPNNSGKTTALQALALWEIGLRRWLEQRPEKATINRRDLTAVPVPGASHLWRDLKAHNIPIDIAVSGVESGQEWYCGFEFDFANEESLYCRPSHDEVPGLAHPVRVAYLPPMSGLAATEDLLPNGAINVRIGEGRTAEVLRNLCYQMYSQQASAWESLVGQIDGLFGVILNPPEFIAERGQITMSYRERTGLVLELSSAGRGLQQTLLLLSHIYTHPNTVLLLDEPDAHLEILRQRQIYQLLTQTAVEQNCQLIAASHSEVILNEAADRDVVVAFVGKPHRIDDRGHQVLKSLRAIGFEHYYQAEQQGWVLYLEGSTDLAILRVFARLLGHPAVAALERPFVHYVGNQPSKTQDHFFGLREAKRDLVGIAIYDSLDLDLRQSAGLKQMQWSRREIENYLANPETLLAFAADTEGAERASSETAMREAIDEVSAALRVLGKNDPFGPQVKASDEFLAPVFAGYYRRLGLHNLMQKADYHLLARFVSPDALDAEVRQKLDAIVECAAQAHPRG